MLVSKILETTLTAGQTSVTFTDSDIPNSLIRIYSNDTSLMYTAATLTGNSLTITYEAQTSNKNIAVELVKAGVDIVDNVTTNDATKALSAKQGKVLKDSLDDLSTTVSNLDIPDNITDLDDVNVTSITDGQVLAWDDVSEKFINVTPSSGGGGIDYSTSEQNTGLKWIDGKDIYQKTVTASSTVAVNNYSWANVSNSIDNPISNIDYLINVKMHGVTPYDSNMLRFTSENGDLKCACYPASGYFYQGLVLTVIYTKSS